MPLKHFFRKPDAQPHVIGLENNCLSHANTQNNEATLKAFKIACLNY